MNKLDALWHYQQAELETERLEAKLKSTPSRQKLNRLYAFLSEQQSAIASIQKNMEAKRQTVDKLQGQVEELEHKYELELSEFEIMKGDDECTAAEMTESRKSVERLIKNMDSARRELFDTVAWIEKTMAEYKETYSKAAKAKKEYDVARAECEKEANDAKPELDKAKAEQAKAAAGVDEELLARYKRIKSHHAMPMARVENNQCSGCNMSLPTSTVKRVAAGDGIVECENCGRILYA